TPRDVCIAPFGCCSCGTCSAPHRAIEPPRDRGPPPYRARVLESGDQRAVVPRPRHGQRTQPQNLREASGPAADPSGRACARAGPAVAATPAYPPARFSTRRPEIPLASHYPGPATTPLQTTL